MTSIAAEVFQNEYLPAGGTVADAVVTVTATGAVTGPASAGASAASVVLIDCSGSMSGDRLVEAKKAAKIAVDTLRDGVRFAVVSGTDWARMVYPETSELAVASAATRSAAKQQIGHIKAGGGTKMASWLLLARDLFRGSPTDIRHAILLTDGRNGDSRTTFQQALDECAGQFVCDCRGVGANWSAAELIKVADALLGTADGMKDPAGLEADFRAMVETAMGKTVAGVSLRLWTPAGARIRFVKQVHPEIVDLTDRRTDVSARIGDYPTGAWGSESRDYHVCVELDQIGAVGEERLAARVSIVRGEDVLAKGLIRAVWTDDTAYSTRINPRVAHYTGEAELADAIQEGLAHREAGDTAKATARLGRAVQLATEAGRTDTVAQLEKVVDVQDARAGTVQLKRRSDNTDVDIDAEMAAIGSRKTTRVRPQTGG